MHVPIANTLCQALHALQMDALMFLLSHVAILKHCHNLDQPLATVAQVTVTSDYG
jgi:hypothetical protein